ncbi:hypothetical protein RclHR1_01030016 [Rhizophagus clarus]|uniref:Uncharacterized protein n=1 Tax=Rhizophagus clarus TaxID=94130 RepID=A0A2Z6QFQ2_9GLOM|nr:hypothetical protein RclHR1_01030016 [Rhizophagus clarus]
MYLRVFNPTSSSFNQLNFIKNKNEYFQYGYDLTESIQLTFYSAYNSSYQHLFSKNSKSSDKSNLSRKTQDIEITELVEIKETGEIKFIKKNTRYRNNRTSKNKRNRRNQIYQEKHKI